MSSSISTKTITNTTLPSFGQLLKKWLSKIFMPMLALLLTTHVSWGQVNYVSWDFTPSITSANYCSNTTNQTNARTSVLTSSTISTITATGASCNSANTFHRSAWSGVTALDVTKYLEFSITLGAGQTFQNSTLNLAVAASVSSTTTAPRNYSVYYAWDAATPVIVNATSNAANATPTTGGTITTLTTSATTNNAVIPAPGNTTSTKLTIRFLAYGSTAAGGSFQLNTVALTGASAPLATSPSITPTPNSLTGLTYVAGSGPSTASPFTLAASNLTAGGGTITISESTDYEVSTTSSTTGFGASATLTYTGTGSLAANTVWVRLKSGRSAGIYNSQSIGISGGGATSSVAVSGNVTPANDDCAGAINLTVNGSAVVGSFTGSTPMTGATKNDVFFMFTPSVTGSHTVTINTFSVSGDRDLYVYSVCPTTYSTTTNVVASGTSSSTSTESATGASLTAGTSYKILVQDFAAAGGTFNISVSGPCLPPTTQASVLTTSNPGSTQLTANWTAGNGDGTMIVIRPTAQTLTAPINGTPYTANTDYTLAGQINTNNRVVFRAAGTGVTVSGLTAATQYTATAYEYTSSTNCYNLTSPLSSSIYTLSTEPLAHAASFTATATGANSINLGFSAASTITNATGYIILQKTGNSAPTGIPADATAYSVGNTIGDATVAAIITSTASTSTSITSLTANTDYSFTIIPYNWNGSIAATYNYYTAATIPSATTTTLNITAPFISSPTVTAITSNSATLGANVTNDGGDAITVRGIVWSVTSSNNDPLLLGTGVTDIPVAGTTGVFTTSASSLPAATQISFKGYATNSLGTTYTSPTSTFTTLATAPTVAASSIVFNSFTANSINLSWTNGDGANRIVVARLTATTKVSPLNATSYTANSASFTDGLNSTTGTGNVVIFNGTGNTVNVTGLAAGASYTFDIYEYNGSGVTSDYFTGTSGTKSTLAAEPTVQASGVNFTNVSSTGFTINWTKGSDAANSLVIVKDVSAVDSDPVDGTSYTANSAFGSGSQLGTGNYVVYRATLATINITGLTDGHTYHVAVYSYNGTAGSGLENYLITSPARGNQVAQTPTYYSQGSLDPASLSSWNSIRTGGGSAPSSFTTNAAFFVIQNGHTMTTTTAFSLGTTGSKLQIENGGILSAGHAITIPSGATFQIDNGGKYQQTAAVSMGSNIFGGTEVFAPNSTVEYTVNPSGTSTPSAPGYGNLIINVTTGATSLGWSNTIALVQGNLTVLGTGTGATRHAFAAGTGQTLTIGGNFTVTGGNMWLSSGAGAVTVNLTGDLVINGGTLDLANSSGVGIINVNGDVKVTSGTLTEGGSTTTSKIVFNKTGGQNFVSGGTVSNTVNFEVASGSLTNLATNVISGGGAVTVDNGGTLKVGSTSASGAIAGNITAAGGAILSNGSTVEFNGAGAQFAAARTFSNLTINNSNGVSLLGDATVNGILGFTIGKITTGANKVIISSTGSVTGGGTGWVIGNLQKSISATGNISYEIGGASNYRPVDLTFNSVTTPGSLTASVTQTNAVYSPLTGSGIDPAKTLLRNYKLTNSTLAGNYDATFNFIATDVPAGASTSTFIVGNTPNSGANWTATTPGTRTTTSTQATGITTFGDFVIGNIQTYTISATAGSNGSIAPAGVTTINYGGSQSYTITPDAGYHIADVLVDGGSVGAVTSYTGFTNVTANHTIAASFAINTYSLTTQAGGNGTITAPASSPTTVNHGDATTITAVANTGYHFVNWTVESGSASIASATSASTTVTLTSGDATVQANFAINTYSLATQSGGNGSITAPASSPTTVNHGAATTITAVANTGYHFVNWTVESGSASIASATSASTTVTLTSGDATIQANFAINTYTLTYTTGANGSITGTSPQTVNYGANGSQVTAVANSGYHFVNWSDASTSNPRTDVNVTADISVTANFAQDACVPGSWIGTNGNWTDAANWCGGVPSAGSTITISSGNVILNTDFDVQGSLTLSGTATLTINPNVTLKATSGTINFGGKPVTIKSDITGTGSIGLIANNGANLSGATNVTVERYIPQNAYRAWRLLSVPTRSSGQTFHQAWQENQGALVNGIPGKGTLISTATAANFVANGFDAVTQGGSLRSYNGSAFVDVANTNTALETKTGYFLYVRGDRSIAVNGSYTAAGSTTLRTTGTLYQGNSSITGLGSGLYALVGNVYASEIDFSGISRTGIDNKFYVWDASLGGTYGGAYRTFLSGSQTGGTYVMSGGSATAEFPLVTTHPKIASGQAFLVHTNAAGASITLSEGNKSTGHANQGFRPAASASSPLVLFSTNLYSSDVTNALDGNVVVFDNAYSNDVDNNDAIKITNPGENLGILRNGRTLAIELRQPIAANDTIFFRMWNMQQKTYRLELAPTNIDPTISVKLEDKYLGTSTAIDVSVPSHVTFTVNSNAASSASDRFRIVFKQSALPVSFISISANIRAGVGVQVDWKVAEERSIVQYEVERSADGRNFNQSGIVTATGKNSYSWIDITPLTGAAFYRIKSIGLAGDVKYTNIAKVFEGNVRPGITVSPNPVEGGRINVQFKNEEKGRYELSLMDLAGKLVYTTYTEHSGGNSTATVELPSLITKGTYQLLVISPSKTKTVQKLFINSTK